jgi:DNA polymerase-3 subunit beta
MVLPKDNDKSVVFDLDDMKKSVRRVSLMADDRNRSIRLTVREGEIELSAQSSEEGEGRETVPAEYTGEEVQLGFNWQYLQEFLNNVGAIYSADGNTGETPGGDETERETDGDKVRVKESKGPVRISFEFKDANAQTQMRIAGDTPYDYKYIVMPLRI